MKNNENSNKKPLIVQDDLLGCIINGIREKKGKEIITINLQDVENSICDHFVICEGDSSTQVNAIANSVEKEVREHLHKKTSNKEGFENAQWMILDYFDVIVHIFQPEARQHYRLEELWADAKCNLINDN